MRKYAIPKAVYGILVLILLCLSIGYTYAYFSAVDSASSTTQLGLIDISWRDNNHFSSMQFLFDKTETDTNEAQSIAIIGELERGKYTEIKANNKAGTLTNVRLEASNSLGTVGAYCRIKLEASYIPLNSATPIPCSTYIKLALDTGDEKVLITDLNIADHNINGWFYDNGYYYYGTKTTDPETGKTTYNLTELTAGGGQVVADYLYLDTSASSNMFGSSVSIKLTLEGVQSANNAYESIWTELGA